MHHILEIDIYIYVYHINIGFIFKIMMYCVVGGSVNNQKSNIRNNGEYFYIVKNIKFCSYSDYGCIQVKVHNYNYNYNLINKCLTITKCLLCGYNMR